MTLGVSVLAGLAAWMMAVPSRPRTDRLAVYVDASPPERAHRLRHVDRRWLAVAAAGAAIGSLAAMAIDGAPPAPLAVAGAAAGALASRALESSRRERRARRLRQELPLVADALAMRILAGASVPGALIGFGQSATGVASDEITSIIERHQDGLSLEEAMHVAGSATADLEAARLYELLSHAHRSGGRLADALLDLAADYRAGLTRDLTAEGGRRALAAYAPILALMVPVTLLFLMYPTLTGLSALSQGP